MIIRKLALEKQLLSKNSFRFCEFVSPDHCDKICDRIADKILDEFIIIDKDFRSGIEVIGSNGEIIIRGEVSLKGVDLNDVNNIALNSAKKVLSDINENDFVINCKLRAQDFTLNKASALGAGDQAICMGYATDETKDLMPKEYILARNITFGVFKESLKVNYLGSDGKILLFGNDKWDVWIRWNIINKVKEGMRTIENVIRKYAIQKIQINCYAEFENSRFSVDTGVLGRKIVHDQYGMRIPIGGGAISGKDPSKIDRSGNYGARWYACEIVRKYGGQALVWLGYTLGRDDPIFAKFIHIIDDKMRSGDLKKSLFSLKSLIERFELDIPKKNRFYDLATFGHYGRNLPWD